jgi:hypothetical protein
MNDLVVGTFGRGIYILDDYSALRASKPDALAQASILLPIREALLYIPTRQYGLRGKGFQGSAFYTADNPRFGATFTYYLKDGIKTRKEKRQEAERDAQKKNQKLIYPAAEQLRAEAEEEAPSIHFDIADQSGTIVRTIGGPVSQGFHRVSWDLREPAASLPRPRLAGPDDDLFFEPSTGPLVMPGRYRVTWAKREQGVLTPLPGAQEFNVVVEGAADTNPDDRKLLLGFQQKVTRLERAVAGALESANGVTTRLEQIKRALESTPSIDPKLRDRARALEKQNRDILRALRGDVVLRGHNENTAPAIAERVGSIVQSQRLSLSRPTTTQREEYAVAGKEFATELEKLRTLVNVDLKELEKALDLAGAPYTPGRLPEWKDR